MVKIKLRIIVFKPNGTFYIDGIVENKTDILLYKDEFKVFIKDNLPGKYTGGYVVVEDMDDNQSFHNVLYKYDELQELE